MKFNRYVPNSPLVSEIGLGIWQLGNNDNKRRGIKLSPSTGMTKNAVAVKSFDKEKYLGKWFEIARLDFIFERNMNNTTAEYSLNENGSIKVNNQGYNTKNIGYNTSNLLWIKHHKKK